MPNRQVFRTEKTGRGVTKATGKTSEGIRAYEVHPEQTLAELACVGTFNNTFYNSAESQLDTLLTLGAEVSDEYLARLAVYSRKMGFMKDMPVAMLALLSTRNTNLFNKVFHKVVDNVRMIRGFVQVMRSGAVGRKSLGTAPKKRVQEAIQRLKPFMLLDGSVGNDPSLADVIKMVHPKPISTEYMTAKEMEAAFAWIIGKEVAFDNLPRNFQAYEDFKKGTTKEVPHVNFRLIDGLPTMSEQYWRELGYTMNWTTLRMNLNTLNRHNAFDDKVLVKHAAKILSDPDLVHASRCFPYQIKTAYDTTKTQIPQEVSNALQDALDASIDNVPTMPGRILICIDISGSMDCSVGGGGKDYGITGNASKTTCMDIAGLFGAAIFKKNADTVVKAFSDRLYDVNLNPRDSVATITDMICGSGSHGGTNLSAGVAWALNNNEKFDAILFFSDMEANISESGYVRYGATRTASLLQEYRHRVNRGVKVVLCNLAANKGFSQLDGNVDRNVLQIAGFSDQVFNIIHSFLENNEPGHWVSVINNIQI